MATEVRIDRGAKIEQEEELGGNRLHPRKRYNVGSNWMVAVEMVRSVQILEIREGDATGFADGLDEECERREASRIDSWFYLEQQKNCDCCHLRRGGYLLSLLSLLHLISILSSHS